jgi:hypothetical protein
MEYLLISAFVFVLIGVIMVVAYSQSAGFAREVSAAQVQKVGSQITDSVNAVYFAGPPSKKTITVYFPELINNITISGASIVFDMQGTAGPYTYATGAVTNMTGSLRPFPGIHRITITALATSVNVTDG